MEAAGHAARSAGGRDRKEMEEGRRGEPGANEEEEGDMMRAEEETDRSRWSWAAGGRG